MEDWSPWSFPFIGSTSFPGYTWDASNGAWILSGSENVATKFDIVDPSVSTLYSPVLLSSSAQFFPGCKINFTVNLFHPLEKKNKQNELFLIIKVQEASNILDDDGFALIEQWVQGGTLCQEGTIFYSGQGILTLNFASLDSMFSVYV